MNEFEWIIHFLINDFNSHKQKRLECQGNNDVDLAYVQELNYDKLENYWDTRRCVTTITQQECKKSLNLNLNFTPRNKNSVESERECLSRCVAAFYSERNVMNPFSGSFFRALSQINFIVIQLEQQTLRRDIQLGG